mmetsp:Transcript_3638/g.10368  ORF Transcript_3638/g.10368 Transcript_3638/m.10368 type:complete len:398 (+) Transcript_3638:35-1228(+)
MLSTRTSIARLFFSAISVLLAPPSEGFLAGPPSSSSFIASLHGIFAAKDAVSSSVNADILPRARRRRLQSSVVKQPKRRQLSPPFPNGLCGGSLVVLPPEQTYGYNEEDNAYLTAASSGDATSILLPPRPISVWLPPSYEASGRKRHRVIYVHDGQNAIDDADSWTGSSWRMAGALTRLAERGALDTGYDDVDPLPILVLLPSADGDFVPGMRRRHLEYGEGVHGEHHADFIAERLMPLINDRFRTVTEAEGAMAIGTSMGGQASLHLLLRHPTMFGGAACLSPAFQPATIASVATSGPDLLKSKNIYIDNGGDDENANVRVPMFDLFDHITPKAQWNPGYFWLDTQLQPAIDATRATLDFHKVEYCYRKFPGGRHNEREWAKRIDLPLIHLLGKKK